MKKLILTLTILFSLTGIAKAGCYGVQPLKPYTYCNGGWQLICIGSAYNGTWQYICVH